MPDHHGTFCFDPRALVPDSAWDVRGPGLAISRRGREVWTNAVAHAPLRRAGMIAAWEGRLDNRADLCLRLGISGSGCPDAELALRVFERWRGEGLIGLIGEWSLAVCDEEARALHLARDYMGVRPLYYCATASAVHWSTNLGELVVRSERFNALSDAFAAQFMSLRRTGGVTPYEGILAVPPGTCVSFAADGSVVARRFWNLRIDDVRYRDERQYEEQLRSLWRDAVGARLGCEGTVWAELSGGLDSSSVACMADWLIRESGVPARALRFVSHATLHSPDGDERRFIAEVERQAGVQTDVVGVEDSQDRADADMAWITPDALQAVGLETTRRVRRGGGAVVLSGRLGDAVMGCQPDNSVAVLDDFSRLDFVRALAKMRRWSRATRKPFIEIAGRLLAPCRSRAADTGIELLTPRLRETLEDGDRRHRSREVRRSRRSLAEMLLAYADGYRLDIPYRPSDIVYTYPFAHRPLVEFVLAIPGDQLSAPGNTRALMRRAFAGFVPPRILRRQSKGYYPPAAFRAAREAVNELLDVRDLEVVQRGWIDPVRLQQALRTLTDGSGASGGDIHCVLRLERWLRARSIPIPIRKEVNDDAVLHA
jgi:asparagine synthase (glutamine-hydrolysing)